MGLRFLYKLISNTYTGREREPKLRRKGKVNKGYVNVPKKTGTKIYARTEGNRRDEPDTATPMVDNQHIILL